MGSRAARSVPHRGRRTSSGHLARHLAQSVRLRSIWSLVLPFYTSLTLVSLFLHPALVRFLKPKSPAIKLARDASPDDLPPTEEAVAAKKTKTLSDSLFDLKIVQLSLLVDVLAYVGVVFSQNAEQFIIATCMTPFGAGAGPAINSMALALLPSTKIAGRLFGGMAVLQACISSVVGRESQAQSR